MKAIYSFNSRPFLTLGTDIHSGRTFGGFETKQKFLLSCRLSIKQARLSFSTLELYLDTEGQTVLAEILPLFDKVIVIPDIPEKYDYFFSFVKFYAYRLQKEPFFHLDFDLYLFDKLSEQQLNVPLLVDFKETYQFYKEAIFNYVTQIPSPDLRIKAFMEAGCRNTIAYCTGIFGGNNMNLIKEYVDLVFKMTEQSESDKVEKTFRTLSFIEQGSIAILADYYKVIPSFLYKSGLNYCHLIGTSKTDFYKYVPASYLVDL